MALAHDSEGEKNMQHIVNRFWNDDLGSTVVDWCILGAGVVSLSVAVVATLA